MQPPKSSSGDIKCSVLERHFAKVVPLLTLIREQFGVELGASSSKNPPNGLSFERWKLLNITLVGIDSLIAAQTPPHRSSQWLSQSGPCTTIHEAVQEAQLQILAKTSTQTSAVARRRYDASNNVLVKGYRRPDDRLESFRITSTGRPGLINLYPNSMVTCLVLNKEWHYLCESIGTERFVWLLVNTSIFVPLLRHGADGTCFVQLTGAALSERTANLGAAANRAQQAGAKRKHGEAGEPTSTTRQRVVIGQAVGAIQTSKPLLTGKRPRKLDRVTSRISARSTSSAPELDIARSQTAASSSVDRKPSEIILVRSRMLYARASRNKNGRVEVGLPSVHVIPRSAIRKELDKVLPSSTAPNKPTARSKPLTRNCIANSKQDVKSPEALFHQRRTRHLAKYVFPRHFGLHNVFTGARDYDTTTQPFRDYTVREVEIKALGAVRTPKALRPVLKVLAKILARHDKINYRALLDRCCPSRVPKGRLTAQERQQIVQDLAEVESLEPTQCQDVPVKPTRKESGCAATSTIQTKVIQVPSDAAPVKAPAKATIELASPALRKPRYTNYAVPTVGQVVHFVTMTIKSLLPRDLFGSLHNQTLLLDTIADFVRLRRYETFNLHQIAQSFRFTDVDWALPAGAVKANRRLTRQEAESRKALVFELLYWLFDGLVIPLLRTTFYITETAAYRNKVLYFRQDDWHVLSRPVLGQLKETIFEPLTRAEALSMMSSRKLGYSHVRLLPKETGVRPIVNLRRRSTKQVHTYQQASQDAAGAKTKKLKLSAALAKQKRESLILGQSINYILQSVFHVLTYEKSRMLTDAGDEDGGGAWRGVDGVGADMLSSSVFGPNEIYARLKMFKQKLLQDRSRAGGVRGKGKLYFVKVDVRCAFDSIDQSKLLEIIEKILCKDGADHDSEGYRIHRFAKVMASATHETRSSSACAGVAPVGKATKRAFVQLARPDSEHIDFFSLASTLAVALHDVVFVDGVSYRYESTSVILKLLRQHITENLIKIGREFYRQRVGIPQGSSLSTLLCSFFYAEMGARDAFLSTLGSENAGAKQRSLLMRYTDDFLLVTTSKKTAKKFYEVMRKGHPDYGCFISAEKTLTNFDLIDSNSTSSPLVARIYKDEFPWCGLTINTRTLGVSTDLTRYAGLDIRDTLTVEYCRRPGAALVEKMIQSVKARCHILFTDTALNGDTRVYGSIYSSFLVAAFKFTAYLAELRRFKRQFTPEFLWKAIQRLVRFTSRYIGSRASSAKFKRQAMNKRQNSARRAPAGRGAGTGRGRGRGTGRSRGASAAWKVSCTIRPHYVHWLGYSAFRMVLLRQAGARTKHVGMFRRLDRDTRESLIGMIHTAAAQSSFAAARSKLAPVTARVFRDAQKSLSI